MEHLHSIKMKKITKKTILLVLLSSLYIRVLAQSNKIYIAMDVNGCNSCLQTASSLSTEKNLLSTARFLFSSDVTTLQAESLIEETLRIKGKVEVNDIVYSQFIDAYPTSISRKTPKLIFYDTKGNKIIRSISLDSISLFKSYVNDFIRFNQIKPTPIRHDIKSIKKLIGYKVLSYTKGNLVINTYQNPHKIFIYNAALKQLDSLVIDTNLEKQILQLNGVNVANFTQELKWHRESGFPHFSSFITNQILNDSALNGVIVTRFYDHTSGDSILVPTQIFQFFNYHILKKRLRLYAFDALWSGDSIDDGPIVSTEEYYQEFDYPQQDAKGDWNTFINFQPKDSFSKSKMLVRYNYHSSSKLFSIDTIVQTIKFDTINTFSGNKFYDPSYFYDYKLRGGYFYYHDAPLIKNINTHVDINITSFIPDATWIDDLLPTKNGIIYILVNSKRGRFLIMIDEMTNTMLANRSLSELNELLDSNTKALSSKSNRKAKKDMLNFETNKTSNSRKVSNLKSNIVIGNDLSIYFINNEGVINQLKPN